MVVINVVVVVLALLSLAMIGVAACSNPSSNAALEGVVSGCGGVDTGELVIEIVADVWHLTELVYRAAPTHLEGGPACTH